MASRFRKRKFPARWIVGGFLLLPSLVFSQTIPIRVGLHDAPPLVFLDEDGSERGFIIEILADIADREGWELRFISGSWQQGLDRLHREEIDLFFPMFPNEERTRLFRFGSEPILSTWGRIFVRRGVRVESILDLDGLRVAVLRGDIFNRALRDLTKEFGLACEFQERDFMEDVFREVAGRSADAAAVERIDGFDQSRRFGLEETHVVFSPGSAFFVSNESGRLILEALDRHLRRIKADSGSIYHRAYERWMGQGPEGLPPWLRGFLIAAGGLILVLVVFLIVLRNRVRSRTRELADRNARLEREIAHRRDAEAGLLRSLEEKSILLKEVHHRVKNNLQVISSLLRLQSREIGDPGALKAFQNSQERISAIALVHKELYGSENFGRVKLGSYVRRLVDLLLRTHQETAKRIGVEIRTGEVDLPIEQAVPCGLIINELVTNAFRHAFPPLFSRRGRLEVELYERGGDEIELTVRDNGIGIPEALDVKRTDSLGLNMIVTMVENQLAGTIHLETGPGTAFRIRFPRESETRKPKADQGSSRRSTS